MEQGTSRGDGGLGGAPRVPAQRTELSGRIPLAVVVVDANGRVTHWSSGARKLFGRTREQAIGAPAVDLMPVSGALRHAHLPDEADELDELHDLGELDDLGEADRIRTRAPGPGPDDALSGPRSYPTAGRARMTSAADTAPVDVLWWAYPLAGPGPERLLVLAADAAGLTGGAPDERFSPGFALHTEFPGAGLPAGRLPDILPNMGPATGGRIVAQVLELGYPVLEISHHEPRS
jgi:hypothetical protein